VALVLPKDIGAIVKKRPLVLSRTLELENVSIAQVIWVDTCLTATFNFWA
jgi:hypothetical protein